MFAAQSIALCVFFLFVSVCWWHEKILDIDIRRALNTNKRGKTRAKYDMLWPIKHFDLYDRVTEMMVRFRSKFEYLNVVEGLNQGVFPPVDATVVF